MLAKALLAGNGLLVITLSIYVQRNSVIDPRNNKYSQNPAATMPIEKFFYAYRCLWCTLISICAWPLGLLFFCLGRIRLLASCITLCSGQYAVPLLFFLLLSSQSGISHAALRHYTWGLFSLNGSVGLRFEDRERVDGGNQVNSTKFKQEISLRNKGFIWDPRFLTLDLGLSFTHDNTTYDNSSETDSERINYSLGAVLFPKWRYPYRPLRFNAYRATTTQKNFGSPSYEQINSGLHINWGLFQKQLGRIRMNYAFTTKEDDRSSADGGEIKHEFDVDGRKNFREGRWGKTLLNYGYTFNSNESDNGSSKSMQNSLYADERTDLGNNVTLNANARLILRNSESVGVDNTSNVFSTSAGLGFQPTKDFRHNYRLAVSHSDNDGDVSTQYSGLARASYRRELNEHWEGTAFSSLNAYFRQQDADSSIFNSNASAGGGLSYNQRFGVYQLLGGYSASLSQSFGDASSLTRFSHSAFFGYSRRQPLFSDRARIRVRNTFAEETEYQATANYSISSQYRLTEMQSINGGVSIGASVTDDGQTGSASGSGNWRYDVSRSRKLLATGQYSVSNNSNASGNKTRSIIRLRYSDRFFLSRRLRFRGEVQRETQTRGEYESTELESKLSLDMTYGKFVGSASYEYSDMTRDGRDSTDQELILTIKRYFGIRY
ncbi:hypothetical protein ACFL0R_05380 [Pseudomonadota bacterium]